jgi:hypothetical protein
MLMSTLYNVFFLLLFCIPTGLNAHLLLTEICCLQNYREVRINTMWTVRLFTECGAVKTFCIQAYLCMVT